MKHLSHRPLLWVCASFILGIIIHKTLNIPFGLFSALAVAFLLPAVSIRRPNTSTLFLLLAVLCIGALYSKNYETTPAGHISKLSYGYRKAPVLIEGTIVSDVERRPFFKGRKTVFSLDVRRLRSPWGWKTRRGVILVNLFREEDVRYGDHILIEGKVHRPFNYANDSRFSYREYLYRQGITFILSVKKSGRVQILARNRGNAIKSLSLRLKHRLSNILEKNLPPEAAGLMQAFLLGDRYNIPKSVYDLFKISGVAHIIAISGFNIGIVTYVLVLILKMFPIPRVAQYFLTMILLALYAFMTGGQPPVVRATIMAVVFLLSFIVEREHEPVNTLAAAALILLLMNPLYLFDVGFQLSFISVLFIILLYPPLMRMFLTLFPALNETEEGDRRKTSWGATNIVRYLLQSVAISIAAYLGVVILVAHYFRLITPVVIIANLIVVPLASLLIFLGMGLLVAGILFPFIAFAFANCIIVILNLMIATVFLFAQIPGAYFPVTDIPLWGIFLYYATMAALAVLIYRRPKKSPVLFNISAKKI
jgi:competence protein ComEC